MITTTYDSNGNQTSSTNSATAAAAPATKAPGASGTSSSSILPFGHYWNGANASGNYYFLQDVVYNQNNNGLGIAQCGFVAPNPMTITAVMLVENGGSAGGTHLVNINVNGGTAQQVTMSSAAPGNSQRPANVSLNVNDQLQAQVGIVSTANCQVKVYFVVSVTVN